MPTSTTEFVEVMPDNVITYKATTVTTDGGGNVTAIDHVRGVYGPGFPTSLMPASVQARADEVWTPQVKTKYNVDTSSGMPSQEA